MREQVFSSPNINVVRVPGAAAGPVFVTFESLIETFPAGRPGFGEAFLAQQGYEAYHVLHASNAWYQYPEMRSALEQVRARIGPDRTIITYGSSMGGYAAYRFSGVLNATRVIAFSPQYTADDRRVPWETRWSKLRASLPVLWDGLPVNPRAEAFLFYDSRSADRRHARLISREMKTGHVRLPYGGHPCMPLLQDLRLLAPVILAIAAGRFDPRACERMIRALREASPRYLSNKALALPRRAKRERLALAERAVALAPDEPWCLVAHGRLLAAHGAWSAAAARFDEAMKLLPDHPPLLLEYRRFLMKAGRWAEAEAAVIRAIDLHPGVLSHAREISVIRAARAHAARPALVRAVLGLVRRDELRRP